MLSRWGSRRRARGLAGRPVIGPVAALAIGLAALAGAGAPAVASPSPRPDPRRVAAVLSAAPTDAPVDLVTVRLERGRPRIERTRARDRVAAAATVARGLADPAVVDVSVATRVTVAGPAPAPAPSSDPYRGSEWGLTTLEAERTWADQPGNGVLVAVIDTGVDAGHPDLAGVVQPGLDLVDPGGDGRVDGHGHGTHVAGIVAAAANNGIGVAGLAQGVKIMPVRALGDNGAGTDGDVAAGIIWAADHGAQVINMSLGSPQFSTAESIAVDYAMRRGAVVVAAAGNERQLGNARSYPAAFPGVIGVAAVDRNSALAGFSNTGSYVDLSAPGVQILSTYPRARYAYLDGTSMASPFVAAAAALVRAAAPTLTPAQVTSALELSAKDLLAPGRDDLSGHGLIRPIAALAAARALAGPAGGPTPGPTTPAPVPLRPTTLSVVAADARVAYRGRASVSFRLTAVDGGASAPLPDAAVWLCTRTAPAASDTCRIAITDADGRAGVQLPLPATTTVHAGFGGTATAGPARSADVTVRVLPSLRPSVGPGWAAVRVAPVAPGQVVRLQRWDGKAWRSVTTRTVPTAGLVRVTGLRAGATYRFAAPATSLTSAAVSGRFRGR